MVGVKRVVGELGLTIVLLGSAAILPAIAASTPSADKAAAAAPADKAAAATGALPAKVAPYTWSASKYAGGSIVLAGFLPSQDVRQSLLDGLGNLVADRTQIASGEPDGFVADASAALDILAALDTGKVSFDGTTWSINGAVGSADAAIAAKSAFDMSPLRELGASYTVSAPAMVAKAPDISAIPPATTAPDVTDAGTPAYAWSAEKAADGTISFNGAVPNDKLQRFLRSEAGAHAQDHSSVAEGAPKDFVGGALNGLDALLKLQSGELLFSNGRWSLAGNARDKDAAAAAHAALAEIDTKAWTFDISISPQAPVNANRSASTAAAPSVTAAAPAAATPSPPPAPASGLPPSAAPAPSGLPASSTAAPAAGAMPPSSSLPAPANTPADTSTTAPASTPAAAPPPAAAVTPPPAPPLAATAPAPFQFNAAKLADGGMALSGDVPSDAIKGYFGDVASDVSTTALKVVPVGAPANFVAEALKGLEALSKLETGELAFDGKAWSLQGRGATLDAQKAAAAVVASLPDAASWHAAIAGPPPLDVCRQSLADFNDRNAITFIKGTQLGKGSAAALDTLASELADCPDARVDIEGNTDSDGNADVNMAVSVARAEAVVAELVKRGVAASRLYAIGYGETLPLVPNTTAQNKARNRRIVVDVEAAGGK